MKTKAVDVVVVGAGPTGLMAGLLLHQCGISFRIVDKNDQSAHESRAFAVHARTMELFQNIGLIDEFLAAGLIALGIQIYVNGRCRAEINLNDIGTDASPYSFILMLPQSEIEKILAAALEKQGIKIEYNTEVTQFEQNDHGVTVTIKNKKSSSQEVHALYLVGADGAHSVVRHGLDLTFEGEAYLQDFMLADCQINWPLDFDFAKIFMHKTFLAIYLPLKGESLSRIIVVKPASHFKKKVSDDAKPLTLAEIERLFKKAAHLPIKLSNATWLTRYHIHHRGVNQYSQGRVFVAGDAAHIHSPAGGQGMNTGIQDVANLIWKLALAVRSGNSKKLLATYDSERRPVGQKLLRFTDNLFARIVSQKPFSAKIRNIILPIVIKIISNIRHCTFKLFRFVSQLGIRYHDNEFLWDDLSNKGFPKNLSAGHRAPNAIYKRNHDVFGLTQGYQFHVLALSKKSLTQEEIGKVSNDLGSLPTDIGLPVKIHFITHSLTGHHKKIIQAESNQIFETYGLSNKNPFGLFLIRPDGYLAYRSDDLHVENLRRFLDKFKFFE